MVAATIGVAVCVVALVVLLVRHNSDAEVSTVAPTPTVDTPIVLMGLRDRVSDPFFLGGGSYRGIWSAWGETPAEPPCTHSVQLVALDPANASGSLDLANLVQVPSTGTTAEIDLINVNPGDYYLLISSACAWQVELSAYE
jgi:hypothetical protein